MLRRSLFALALAAATMIQLTPSFAESATIRVEPRPYYGAVVTVEQGVRVWRPLPPTKYMIINPTGSPVNVNVTDVRETVNHNGGVPYAANGNGYAGGSYGHPGFISGRFGRPGFNQFGQFRTNRAVGHNPLVRPRIAGRRW